MSLRRRANKTRVALWMLVAIGDVLLILAGIGMAALVAVLSVVTVAVAAVGASLLLRRQAATRSVITTPTAGAGSGLPGMARRKA
ncbi:hypothetical protein [Plantactinospora sp. GCM10030261]|uniref:hypothetical protein n=1 Tax=Plantactinospora sp. GCM10030261 TaxID=3273420 RepID=UPI00361153E2